jgi:hypothetical protein
VFNTYSIGQDNLDCQANNHNGQGTMDTLCQPQNGGAGNAAAGSLLGAGPPVNYANVEAVSRGRQPLGEVLRRQRIGRAGVAKMAFSLTLDWDCAHGGGVNCTHQPNKEEFTCVMLYERTWFQRCR